MVGYVQKAVEDGSLTPETTAAFRFDRPVDECPIYHLRGVYQFRDLATLEPGDFLERVYAGAASMFGRPRRPEEAWRTIERFELAGTARLEGDLALVPYVLTSIEADGATDQVPHKLIARQAGDSWSLWFDRQLIPSPALFLYPP